MGPKFAWRSFAVEVEVVVGVLLVVVLVGGGEPLSDIESLEVCWKLGNSTLWLDVCNCVCRCAGQGAAGTVQHHPHLVHPWHSCTRPGGERTSSDLCDLHVLPLSVNKCLYQPTLHASAEWQGHIWTAWFAALTTNACWAIVCLRLRAGPSLSFPSLTYLPRQGHLRRVQRIRSQRRRTARLQSKALKSTTSRGVKVTSSYFSFAPKKSSGSCEVEYTLWDGRDGSVPSGIRATSSLFWGTRPSAWRRCFARPSVSHETIEELQLEVHLVMKLEPRKRRKKKVSAFFCGRI